MNRRKLLLASGVTLTTALAGCSGDTDKNGDENGNANGNENGDENGGTNGDENDTENESEPDENDGDDEVDETATQPETQTFEGSGATVEEVEIEGGLTVVDAEHTGESNFQVRIYEGDDDEYGTGFVNAIGDYEGASADLVEGGTRTMDVEADGSWRLEVRQPRATETEADNLPQSFSGDTPDVVGPIAFNSRHTAYGEHDGESNFQVRVYPEDGMFGEGVFNEIGEYEGETTFSHDGVGWVDVEADGNWTVEME
ncbi:hypothetical protein C477_14103 [Haloterrigena salina JCM 13891]|uniref:Uncharacterized protein n=1 Tax=Haloterrigena salina JCM 13891 TaxID=1227488 RepID=M0C539_9EURY|nr:hypothetical protein [Haloterrigena salina]ELZ17019.1 hypothetical protein C477_14103 [Haloterrigena salina JCM 13891]